MAITTMLPRIVLTKLPIKLKKPPKRSTRPITLLLSTKPALVGVADENAGMLYARYLDTDEGLKKSNIHEAMIEEKRIYVYDTMAIVKPSGQSYVNVEIDTYLEDDIDAYGGEIKYLRVRLTLVKEDGEWRLDTPTY